ncbi:transketolase [Chloroflexota bacterium]
MNSTLDDLSINTLRFLAVDMVQKANSGHPGAPMGMAPMAYVLWDRFLKHSPADPGWPDRDRFVLSAGHASALLYALLYLTGYPLSLDEIKRFRQWESLTPGHPEYNPVTGVETSTGPLGQGFANGVGMALAERWLARHYNRPGHEIIDHRTYAIVSDGDLMEGVASEAASFAGTQELGKLIYLYDSNSISIEGSTEITFRENVSQRFIAYGWNVIGPVDGLNIAELNTAIQEAQNQNTRPNLIVCRTVIGCGSPNKAGTAGVHGEPLGEEEVCLTRENLKWLYKEPFTVPSEILDHFRRALERGKVEQQKWETRLAAYRQVYPELARQLEEDLKGELPPGWDSDLTEMFKPGDKPVATRVASGQVLNAMAKKIHPLTGGSADLAPSNKTLLKDGGCHVFQEKVNHNIHFGVREHAMGAIANGMSLHGGTIPYTGTFLVFYDYMRPAVRLASLMGIRVIYIFTHDSVGVGEDGPTHQPIEHIMGLRLVPNLVTIRPADATETAEAWKAAIERRNGPTALLLSRQGLPVLDRKTLAPASGLKKGGYILWQPIETPEVILMATGSEVRIALEAGKELQRKGKPARVVSLPSWELFEAQPEAYRNDVLPPAITARISIEAGSTLGWERYVSPDGKAIGIDRFGASAPGGVIYEKLGLTVQRVIEEALKL